MKVIFFTLALLSSTYARASNSGIFGDDGQAVGRFAGGNFEASKVARSDDVLVLAPSSTKRITNGERLRRHLPLLPPKRRTGPLSPRASCLPSTSTTYTGKIEVRYTSSAGTAGKIGTSNLGAINFLGPEGDLVVQLTKGPTDEPIEIIPINDTGPSSAYPFFGAVASSTNYLPLQAGSGGTAGFGGVAHTPAGSPPSSVYAESTIWLVDPVSLEIKAEWTEPNGTRHPAIIAYSVRENMLFLTGDIQAYLNSHPNYFASPVTFHLVSPSTTTSVTSCDGSYTL